LAIRANQEMTYTHVQLGSTLRSYAQLARVSNLPTCVSNVLVGVALGTANRSPRPLFVIATVAVGICLLYVAGMALNDAVGVKIDQQIRPNRPIPSGRISVRAAYTFAGITSAIGIAILGMFGWTAFCLAVVLVGVIVGYDSLHHRHPWALILMGVCRGLVYVTAAAAVIDYSGTDQLPATTYGLLLIWLATTIGLYTASMTAIAQTQNNPRLSPRRWLAVLMLVVVVLAWIPAQPSGDLLWAGVVGCSMFFWLGRAAGFVFCAPPKVHHAVSRWLSGMCLVDAYFLALLGCPVASSVALACFLITHYAHQHISGT